MNLAEIQAALREEGLDGWLFFDHHRRDPLAYRILKLYSQLHRFAPLVLFYSRARGATGAGASHRSSDANGAPRIYPRVRGME